MFNNLESQMPAKPNVKKVKRSISKRAIFGITSMSILSVLWFMSLAVYLTPEAEPMIITSSEQELNFWYDLAYSNPTYKQAYINISQLEARSGHTGRALEAYKKVTELDVNREAENGLFF